MPFLEWLGSWPVAGLLRGSPTGYLFINAAHVLSIGLLVGAILPLDCRLMGLTTRAPLAVLAPFLTKAAAVGLAGAIVTGCLLFLVRPLDYAGNPAFLIKLALLAAALLNIALQHRHAAFRDALAGGAIRAIVRLHAACSAALWLAVLLAGRWIGFL